MKSIVVSFFILLFGLPGFSQMTYYWVGGAGPVTFTANNRWNTQLDGMGTTRAAAAGTDILIFDGTNIGGTTPATGTVTATITSTAAGQLRLQNNASVIMQRATAAGGTGTLTINGDGTVAPDFEVNAGSTLTLNSPVADGNVIIALLSPATGFVGGTVTLSNTGGHRISSQVTDGLVFSSGSTFNSSGVPATAAYPFGNNAQAVQFGVQFQSGANLIYNGTRSPMGNIAAFQACDMMPGSNFYITTSNVAGTGSYNSSKTFGNIFVQNNATFTADGPFYKIENLTIDNGCTFITHTSGSTPVLGSLTVNGTLNAPGGSTNIVCLGDNTPQTVSGTGLIDLPYLTVANYSDVTLQKSVTVSTNANIVGKINFGTSNQISGTGAFTSRVGGSAAAVTGNTTAGSYIITNVVGTLSGNTGLAIAGTGVDVNTNVVGFAQASALLYLSKPATSTTTAAAFTFSSDAAILTTANPNGLDTLTGSVIATGDKTFQAGTNLIINAATTKPFPISSGANYYMAYGNVNINAAVTTNYNSRVIGTLTLTSGKLSIRAADSIRILSGNAIGGAPFSNSKYIACNVAGNAVGKLRIDNLSNVFTTLFPVGSANYYLPVTLLPSSATTDHAAGVFEGVTEDGTPTGIAFPAAKKAKIVDAVWVIDRPSGSGNCIVNLQWDAALEGATFATYNNSSIGISHYDGPLWGVCLGMGDNAANNATALYSTFSPFGVGFTNAILATAIKNIAAFVKPNAVEIKWTVDNETGIMRYEIEKSINRIDFNYVGSVTAINNSSYVFNDPGTFTGVVYYRIKMTGLAGDIKYSDIVIVKKNAGNEISLYPNPAVNSIVLSGLKNGSSYKIINAAGQMVMQQKITANSFSIDVSRLQNGLYCIEIFSADDTSVKKTFIKQ